MLKPLGSDWPLHGAPSHVALNAILADLHTEANVRRRVSYDETAARTAQPRTVVAEVASWYQSLWMAP